MSWYEKHIKSGFLFKSTDLYIIHEFTPARLVPVNSIVMIVGLEPIAGNVSYLIGEQIHTMDATSFLTMFAPIETSGI